MKAAEICERAAIILNGDRAEQHGDMRETHKRIARFWSTYLINRMQGDARDVLLCEEDVAWMMALMKIARSMGGEHNDDDYIDAAGYSAIAGELAVK